MNQEACRNSIAARQVRGTDARKSRSRVRSLRSEGAGAPLVPTAAWGYLRLRRTDYGEEALKGWLERIRSQPWREAYVFLKHDEDKPTGPDAAVKLTELAGPA